MKKILSMAALALVMAGCSNDDENVKIDNGEASNAVAIQISQKVAGVESKAAITPGADMLATIIMVDESSSTSSPDFAQFTPKTENELMDDGTGGKKLGSDEKRANVATTEFKANTVAGSISLTPTLYYPVSANSKKTWILGVSPQGVVDKTKVTFNGTADGSQDVMYAVHQAAGASATDKTNPELTFNHQTTQLLFVAQLTDEDLSKTEWKDQTVSVKSIIIQKAQVPTAINIADGSLVCTEKNISVAGCNTALKATPCAKSTPVMIQEASSVVVDLILNVGNKTVTYTNLVVQKTSGGGNLATGAGKSHLITFTITAPVSASDGTKIETTAKIVDWETGEAGKVEIK